MTVFLVKLLDRFPTNESCIAYLEEIRWNGDVVSPFDEFSKVYKTARGFKCKNSGKYFNARTNTIFEHSKTELRYWFAALWIYSMNKNISSYSLSNEIGISQKAAWKVLKSLKYVENFLFIGYVDEILKSFNFTI